MSQTLKIAEQTVVTTTTTTTRYVDDPDGPPCRREEKRIPLLDEGKIVVVVFEPSDVPQEKTLCLETAAVAYQDTRLLGFRLAPNVSRGENANGFPNQDVLVKVDVECLAVYGWANVLLAPVDCPLVPEPTEYRALRANELVQRGNSVQAFIRVRQIVAHKYQITVVLAMDAIVDIVENKPTV